MFCRLYYKYEKMIELLNCHTSIDSEKSEAIVAIAQSVKIVIGQPAQ